MKIGRHWAGVLLLWGEIHRAWIRSRPPLNLWYRIEPTVRAIREFFQDQWFDRTRHVRTSGDVSLRGAAINAEQHPDSEFYMPARPAHIRKALREIPVGDLSTYSYVDLGCGKGRSLFVAAEFSFRQITGVELSPVLYEQSQTNLRSFRAVKRGCTDVRSLHQNAQDFPFPPGNLVLYMFNPFGHTTMHQVLHNLDAKRRQEPCHVVIVLLWPRCQDQVAALEGMRLRRQTKEYQIFEAPPPG